MATKTEKEPTPAELAAELAKIRALVGDLAEILAELVGDNPAKRLRELAKDARVE